MKAGSERVDAFMTVVSGAAVTSPLTGLRGALVQIEVVETGAAGCESLGSILLGDLLTLRDDDGDDVTIVIGRARLELGFGTSEVAAAPLVNAPPEVIPLARRATGRGVLSYRERLLREGDVVRLKAFVEPAHSASSVVSHEPRGAVRARYVTRDDRAPVIVSFTA